MRARIKQLFKRLLKTGGLFILIGIGVMIGFAMGVESSEGMQTIVTHSDSEYSSFESELEQQLEERVEHRIEEQIIERIVIPPIPEIPHTPPTVHIDHSSSFNGIGTVLASLGLIGLGTVMLVRSRRQPKEKSPESLK